MLTANIRYAAMLRSLPHNHDGLHLSDPHLSPVLWLLFTLPVQKPAPSAALPPYNHHHHYVFLEPKFPNFLSCWQPGGLPHSNSLSSCEGSCGAQQVSAVKEKKSRWKSVLMLY
ncbi:hypothetical protein XENOCAPTIV_026596 [Xenoophorus captivus]|uniref:Uncharacterized protein n=1 Tax=Xenoophorus captivus TaxID=1517983 RepID=A0ABV0RIY5_9TELE